MFSQIQGNADTVRALTAMVDSGRVPHAIMFHEDDGGGGVEIALAFLQHLYCPSRSSSDSCGQCPSCNKISKLIHPDVHFVFPTSSGTLSVQYAAQWRSLVLSNPRFTETELLEALGIEGKNSLIAVSEAKALLDTLSLTALEKGWRSVLIYLPEKMNQEAANRLLKMIEEPPAQTQFLLITHSPEKVLGTISSRCQRIRIAPASASKAVSGEMAGTLKDLFGRLVGALCSRDLLAVLDAAEAAAALPSRESMKAFCKFASEEFRAMFLLQQGMPSLAGADAVARECAGKCRRTFPRLASEAVDRANLLLGRNVNAKILFTDLADRLYTIF